MSLPPLTEDARTWEFLESWSRPSMIVFPQGMSRKDVEKFKREWTKKYYGRCTV